jgi:hypothetical protein
MNAFDALAAVNLVVALVALWRLRAATFFFAGNQLAALRALSDAKVHGYLVQQAHLPSWLWDGEQLKIAATIFSLSTAILAVFVALPAPKAPAGPRPPLPALPRWLHLPIAAYFVVLFLSTNTVLSTPYGTESRVNYTFNAGGLHMLIASVVVYEVYRRIRVGSIKPGLAFAIVFVFFVLLDYIKGQTGIAAGYLLFAAILFLGTPSPGSMVPRRLPLALAIVAVLSVSALARGLRASLTDDAGEALGEFLNEALPTQKGPSANGALERQGNGQQYAAHVVECISLYEGGHSREWRSVYNPILYTFEPSFLLEPLDITRPQEAAWELADYFIHGGGIFVVGELYWNGGYLCVAAVVTLILLAAYFCDTRYRASFVWLILECTFAPMLLMGVGYGFAQVSRGFINGLGVLGAYYMFRYALPLLVIKAPALRGQTSDTASSLPKG